MIPIHELLHRIQWDPEFGRAKFVIGYYDRVSDRIVHVPFNEIRLDPKDRFAFHALDEEGVSHAVPLHRVREVYRDGLLIWKRKAG